MRHPRRWGRTCRALLLGILMVGAVPVVAVAAALDQLPGAWAEQPGSAPAMEWVAAEDGFTVSWTPPGGSATTVHFTPTGRPGVFGGQAKAGWSIMESMFGDDTAVNPLQEGDLFWARAADETVFLYRLAIGDGGEFELDRYACRPQDGALAMSLQRRTHEGMTEPTERQLVRIGK